MTALLRILERATGAAAKEQAEALAIGARESAAFCAGLACAYTVAAELLREWLPLIVADALDAGRREERLADA